MIVAELLSELRARDIGLRVEGDRLKSFGQKGNLTPELADHIRRHKAELLELLSTAEFIQTVGEGAGSERVPEQRVYPLSITQARVVASSREGASMPTAFRLKGALDVAALRETLACIVRRHPTLRSAFDLEATPAVQRVMDSLEFEVPFIDLSASADPEASMRETVERLRGQRLDVSRLPLFTFSVIALSETEHVLFTAFSPLVFDGWSFDILWNELCVGYAALCKGQPWPLPELAGSYADYVSWQGRVLAEKEPKLAEFWQKRLGEQLPELPLPTDRPRAKVTSSRGGSFPLALTSEVTTALRGFASRVGGTPQLVMLSAFYSFLARFGEAQRIVVGSPIEGRNVRGFEQQVGPFVNVLLLPMDVDLSLPFDEFVPSVRDEALNAYEHQEYPIERLSVRSPRVRGGGLAPAFQVEFSFQQVSQRGSHMGPLDISQIELESGASTNDWTVWVKDWGDRLAGAVEFKVDLFDRETIRHWSACYVAYLSALMAAHGTPMAEVDLLGGEQSLVERAWKQAAKNPPPWLSALPGGTQLSAIRIQDAAGGPLPLGAFGELLLVSAGGTRAAGVRARLRADGTLERAPEADSRAFAAAYVPPTTDIEKKVVRLFEELLNLKKVGIDDDYFELGGNSLLALKLFIRIHEVCGVKLPQATLLDAGSPRLLAKAVSNAFSLGKDQCLVLLRKGTTKQAMFFVHDGDGETLLYLNVARRLKPEYDVWGIHPLSLGAAPMVHTSVEEAAKHYASEMRRVCPEGPYRVGGLCAGGILAFAAAAELEAQGETVELLAIGEAAPEYAEKRRTQAAHRMNSASRLVREGLQGDFVRAFRTAAQSLVNTGRYEVGKLGRRVRQTASTLLLQGLARTNQAWPRQLVPPSVRDVWEIVEPKYKPARLVRTTPVIVRASSGDGTPDDKPLRELLVDPSYEWQPLSERPVRLMDVPGGRSTMWQEPHVADLARQLDALLP